MKRKRSHCPHCSVGYVYENDNECANCGKEAGSKQRLSDRSNDKEKAVA